jgi:hypothetical protein
MPPEPGSRLEKALHSQSWARGPAWRPQRRCSGKRSRRLLRHPTNAYGLFSSIFVQRPPLPASPATVCAYLGTLSEKGRLRGTSLRPYVAAIGAQHRRLALEDPTSLTLVALARRGFAAFPADAALHCLRAALSGTTSRLLRYLASVAVGFLISARPASIAGITSDAVRLEPDAVHVYPGVQVWHIWPRPPGLYPHPDRRRARRGPPAISPATSGCFVMSVPPLIHFTRPLCGGRGWPPRCRLSRAPWHPLHPSVSTERGNHRCLRGWGAIGGHHAREQSCVHCGRPRHYLAPLVPPTPAARVFFHRFVPAARSLSEPV